MLKTFALAGCLALLSLAVQAESKPAKPAWPCLEDAKKFCPPEGQEGGRGRVRQCLEQHAAELSPACQAARQARSEQRRAFHDNCRADIRKLCRGIRPGGGAILKCLSDNSAQLTPACAEALPKPKP